MSEEERQRVEIILNSAGRCDERRDFYIQSLDKPLDYSLPRRIFPLKMSRLKQISEF